MRFNEIAKPEFTITDSWFDSPETFMAYKKPIAVSYQHATESGSIDTLEGPMRYEAGHYIMTGPKGEKYPITPEKFNAYYDDLGNDRATPKKIVKQVRAADHDGVLHTSWGDMAYRVGEDFIVQHGNGDYGAVKKDIFRQTYEQERS